MSKPKNEFKEFLNIEQLTQINTSSAVIIETAQAIIRHAPLATHLNELRRLCRTIDDESHKLRNHIELLDLRNPS